MNGETDPAELLKTLEVKRRPGVWQYVTHKMDARGVLAGMFAGRWFGFRAKLLIQERDGATEIVQAKTNTPSDNRWVWLEVSVTSPPNAVGLIAALSRVLSDAGIPCNVVSGYFHDHLFVPEALADDALVALEKLKSSN